MKKLLIASLVLVLTGCGDGWSSSKCFMYVKQQYPMSEVSELPKNDYRFLVKHPSGEVIIAEMMGTELEITKEYTVFKGEGK